MLINSNQMVHAKALSCARQEVVNWNFYSLLFLMTTVFQPRLNASFFLPILV